ncbi:MAG: MOSC domain-containing protein [Bacteroidia bacterium]|nr:MOSC domain-containing protein [Bacteroidia bacterium]
MVSGIYIYPVKGLPGLSLQESHVLAQGLKHDRTWMLVDDAGTFISQRSTPILSQFRLEPNSDGFTVYDPNGLSSISIPFYHHGKEVKVQVWDDTFNAQHFSTSVDLWFSNILNISCQLVCIGSNSQRLFMTNNSPEIPLSFVDACPILLIGNSSLLELNSRLAEPIKMDRFRPNLVVDDFGAFMEHELGSFKLGENTFKSIKSCARCSVTTINQQTGKAGLEPLKTLSTFRQKDNKVYFGEYVYFTSGSGIISLGDRLYYRERG